MGETSNNSKENCVMCGQHWMGIFGAANKRSENKYTRHIILLLMNLEWPALGSDEASVICLQL